MGKNKRKMMIAYLSLASTLLAGCNSNNNINQNTTEYTNKTTSEVTTEIMTTEASTQMTEEITTTENTTEEKTTENTTEEMTTEEITTESKSVDDEIIDNINDDKNKIELYVTKEDYENVKKYGREFFIKMVDFIFYDKDINGIKFSDLKEETKEEVYNTFCDIDALIMTFSPDYKENIGEKYEVVKDFTSKTYYNALDKIREAIGDEKYDKVKEIKDNTKEKIKDGTDNAKEYIKKKYENWRDR